MSGIAALVAPPSASASKSGIQTLLQSLVFRGPDAQEYELCGSAALAHALLLTDEQEHPKRQPLSFDGATWVAADARLDAREKLAEALQAAPGKPCTSLDDAELILRAYAAWGERCVEHLLGDFSFILWDGQRNLLLCARDQLGVKPLFYAPRRGGFAVSNTLQCLAEWAGDGQALNDAAVGDFLLFGYNQNPATTFFREIQSVPPAHVFIWRAGEVCLRRYWTCPGEGPLRFRRAEDCIEEFRGRLQKAVSDRIRNGRASILFSGGMDSTSIAATAKESLAARGQPANLKAFTAVYQKLFDDREGEFADLAAHALQIPVEFVAGDECALFAPAGRSGTVRPEPSDEPLAAFGESLYRAAALHSRVGLAGEGGDVILHPQSGPYLGGCRHCLLDFGTKLEIRWAEIGARHFPSGLLLSSQGAADCRNAGRNSHGPAAVIIRSGPPRMVCWRPGFGRHFSRALIRARRESCLNCGCHSSIYGCLHGRCRCRLCHGARTNGY